MAFSLSNWFKGKPGAPGSEHSEDSATADAPPATVSAPPPSPAPAPAPAQAAAVRKVVPNSVQPVSLRTPGSPGARKAAQLPVSTPSPAPAPFGKISPVIPASHGKISFGSSPLPDVESPAPAAVPAPAAIAEVIVSLEVGDFLDRLPPSFVRPGPVDRHRRVDFRASELYSDMTKGRASVPASIIYQKCPELFTRPVTDEEDTEISLPLQKLVEQMSQAFQTRSDQVAEENVGEIETPFLQVAMEDSARLPKAVGTTAGALRPAQPLQSAATSLDEPPFRPHRTGQISTISPPRPQPEPLPMPAAPTAQSVAPINPSKRPPSTVRASVAGGKIRLSGPSMPSRMVPVTVQPPTPPPTGEAPAVELPPSASQRILPPLQVPGAQSGASPSHQVSKKTARIQIPPISLRPAGASSRPAAPSAPPAVPVQRSPLPVRPGPNGDAAAPPMTFRSSPPPPSTAKPMPHSFAPPQRPSVPPPAFAPAPAPAPIPAPAPTSGAVPDQRKISLSLAAVLRGLPISSLTVEPNSVADDVRLTLPFALVEPQLAHGRVSVAPGVFTEALPDGYREVLAANSGLLEVPLPLQEVFQNLPPAALAIREDQFTEEIGTAYPTPFSQKADEDAQRFGTPSSEAEATQVATEAPKSEAAPETLGDRVHEIDIPLDTRADETSVADHTEDHVDSQSEARQEEDFASLAEESAATAVRDIPIDIAEDLLSESNQPIAGDQLTDSLLPAETAQEAERPATETSPTADTAPRGRDESGVGAIELPAEDHQAKSEADAAPSLEELRSQEEEPSVEEEPTLAKFEDRQIEIDQPAVRTPVSTGHGTDSVLQSLFMTEDDLDAKSIVRHVSALPGLEGCAVMFDDGLQLAGNFPTESDAEGFSAMAPPFFKRVRNFTGEINLGTLQSFTLYTERGVVSFFMHDQICVSVRHAGRGFLPGVREKLEVVTRELARMYATAGQAH